MTIETKYDIGQEFWFITEDRIYSKCPHCGQENFDEEYDDFWKVTGSVIIAGILKRKYDILYVTSNDTKIDETRINERWFTTRELAQAECDRRNQGGKN